MKKYLLLLLFLILFFVTLNPVSAQTLEKGENVQLAREKTLDQDYFAWGEKVNISGTVNGDAYIMGSNTFIDGTINGDLFIAGGTVNIRGNILKDLRVAGGDVTISGKIEGNVTALGGNVNITDGATINGSLTSGGGNLSVFGKVGRGATIGAGSAIFGNSVGGNITAGTGDLILTSSANINGNLKYYSSKKATIQNGALVKGSVTQQLPPKQEQKQAKKLLTGAKLTFSIISLISALIIGFILVKLMPNFTQSTAANIRKKPIAMFAVGLLAIILIPITSIFLLVTLVGIPISVFLIVDYFIALYISKLFVAVAVGQKLLANDRRENDLFLSLAAGMIIYLVLGLIPFVGLLTTLLVVPTGFGALLISKKDLFQNLRNKKLL